MGSGSGQFNAIHEIDTAPNGQVFTVETGNQRVQRFNAGGGFRLLWGNPGPAGSSKPGEFNAPQDVAVGADMRVYVADTNNHRIQWFTPEGVLGGSWGSEGTGNGSSTFPLIWPPRRTALSTSRTSTPAGSSGSPATASS